VTAVELSGPAVVAAAAALAAGAAAQGITGFGFSLVAAPVLVLLVGPAHAVRLINVLAVSVNLLLLAHDRGAARYGDALRLLVPAAVVAPLAAYVVHRTDARVLSVVIGVLISLAALAVASGARSSRLRGPVGAAAAGALSAAMNTASGVGGPAIAMYAVNADWPAEAVRPTLQVYFLGLNVLSFVALGPVWPRAAPAVALLAAVAGGLAGGLALVSRLSAGVVQRAVLGLALAGGITAVIRGLVVG